MYHKQVLEKGCDEFKMLRDYTKNTHGATHNQYDLELMEVFKVRRQGEDKRFKPFSKFHNRMLLWHGSRTTNLVGILSQVSYTHSALQVSCPQGSSLQT